MPPSDSGRFRVIRRLAVGGMGEVFLAVLTGPQGFEKPAVIKRLLPELAIDREQREAFLDEARLMSNLSHSNVVSVLDLGEADGGYFIALEYVEGTDLHMALKSGLVGVPLALYLVRCVLRALAYVHGRKSATGEPLHIIHRDISPGNVLLGLNGDVKLSDFGIARALSQPSKTGPGVVKGKLAYMAPEQAQGLQLDARSDLFSVGVLLFELLTGRRPFSATSDLVLFQQIAEAPLPDPRAFAPSLSAEHVAVLERAMAKQPADRFQSADEMLAALERAGEAGSAGPVQVAALVQQVVAQGAQKHRDAAVSPFAAALGLEAAPEAPATKRARSSPAAPASRRVWPFLLLGAAAAAGIASVLLTSRGEPPAAPPAPAVAALPPAAAPAPEQPSPPAPGIDRPARPANRPRPRPAPPPPAPAPAVPAHVDVNTTPWSEVWVDGENRGPTPRLGLELAPGKHRFEFKRPGVGSAAEQWVQLQPGEKKTIALDLEGK